MMVQKTLFLLLFCFTANLSYTQKLHERPDFIENELLIWLEPSAKATDFSSKLGEFGLSPKRQISKYLNIWLYTYTKRGANTTNHFSDLRSNPMVKFVQNNHYLEMRSAKSYASSLPPTTPNDTHYSQQWGMDKINMPAVWGDYSTGGTTHLGDKIVVAVIDDQFDLDHPDLNFWVNNSEIPNDGIDNDNNAYQDDYLGWDVTSLNGDGDPGTNNFSTGSHATLVSGIIGAKGNNNTGVTGVNWDIEILPIRIGSSGTTDADAFAAYSYAYNMRNRYNATFGARGAFIVATNSSFGIPNGLPSQFPMWCAMYETLGSVGILSCGAAPNKEENVETAGDIPTRCTSDYLVGVTSTDSNDNKVNPAGYGTTSIDIGAPGGHLSSNDEIFSTAGDDTYNSEWGTSYASPHVTGTIALMYAAACEDLMKLYRDYPAAVALQIKHFLLSGADQLSSLNGLVAEGRRLNALGAIEYVRGVQTAALEPTLDITTDLTWAEEKVVFGNILVKTGNTLTVESGLIMPKDGKITVEKGAKLVVNGGRITTGSPSCIGYWKGIDVIGDRNQAQTAINQGVVELTNATIEYANTAIYTGANQNGWQGGAIIQANNTTFRNNRRAVAFLQYTQSDNLSYFIDCTFEIDADYPQSDCNDMVTMWDVKGVDFTNCVFRNTNPSVANEKRGVYTIDAGFDISGTNSSFSGFEGGIISTNSNSINTFSVEEATFSNNAVGIYAGSVDNITVTSNNFTIGQFNTSTYNHGLLLATSTAYQVEENIFDGDDQVTGGMDLIGVECQNSGDDNNQIYKNEFSDLHYGARAFGDNRNSDPYLPTGLSFICNTHTDNTYDFRVDKDNSISAAFSGIMSVQGIYFQSAGNNFSLNSTPTGSDYYNETPNLIVYYYDNSTGGEPLNRFNVNLPGFGASANGCSSQLSMMMASSEYNQQQFYDNQAAYQTALKSYHEKIDGGQTKALLTDLEWADSRSAQALYEDLLQSSPWLSATVLEKVLDRSDLFTFEQVNNLLLANPDLRKASLLWERLTNQFSTEQVDNLKSVMESQIANERSELEETLGYHFTEMQTAANALIRNAIRQGTADPNTARNWLSKKATLNANYAIVESWLQEKQANQALSVMDQIPRNFSLEPHQELGYLDYQALTQLKVKAMKTGRTIADFTKAEVQELTTIADRNHGRAGVQARGILNFFYGYEYVNAPNTKAAKDASNTTLPTLKVDQPTKAINQSLISVFPNPANEVITFNYNLNGYPDARVVLQIFDQGGRAIKTILLDPMVSEMQWNTSQLEAGSYIYQLTTSTEILTSGQFLITR